MSIKNENSMGIECSNKVMIKICEKCKIICLKINGAVVVQKMLNLYVFFLTLNMGKVYCHDSFRNIASENPKLFLSI